MIIQIIPIPKTSKILDLIIEQQAQYYGQKNQHIISYLEFRIASKT